MDHKNRGAAPSLMVVCLVFGACAADQASDQPGAMRVPATLEQMQEFRDALNRWSSIETDAPRDVDEMVRVIQVVVTGVLGPAGAGRKSYAPPGDYDSYANLELRNIEVLKGTLAAPAESAFLEVSWPNNLELDELVDATPVGARVIVLADSVAGALEMAELLRSNVGIDAIDDVKANLLTAPGNGLLLEDVTGQTHRGNQSAAARRDAPCRRVRPRPRGRASFVGCSCAVSTPT